MSGARGGFTLVEVVVALGLIAVAALSAGAAATLSAGALERADRRAAATAAAELVLDSLARAPAPESGDATIEGVRVEWTVSDDAGARSCDLRAGVAADGSAELTVRALLAPPPPILGAAP